MISTFVSTVRYADDDVLVLSASKNTENDDLWARQSYSTTTDNTVVKLLRPLGLVENKDEDCNVQVEKNASKGNVGEVISIKKTLSFFSLLALALSVVVIFVFRFHFLSILLML